MGKTFKSLVTEPRVTGGGSDKEGEALELQEMREADPHERFDASFCDPYIDRLWRAISELFAAACCSCMLLSPAERGGPSLNKLVPRRCQSWWPYLVSDGGAAPPAAGWLGHHNVIHGSAPAHATLAQPAAGADALKDLRAQRAHEIR
mgnify:CR=1 FL=1